MSQKQPYHHGNLRAALLEAAFSILVESGVQTLSLRSVARRAGVSPGAPYHHFKDKQAILAELANDRRQRAASAFAAAIAAETTPQAKLRALGRAYIGHALEHEAEFKLMFSGSLGLYGAELGPEKIPLLELFKTLLHELDDQLSDAELKTAGIAVWSQVHGFATLLTEGPLRRLRDDPGYIVALTEDVTRLSAEVSARALRECGTT